LQSVSQPSSQFEVGMGDLGKQGVGKTSRIKIISLAACHFRATGAAVA
jgi:hypothetical protein